MKKKLLFSQRSNKQLVEVWQEGTIRSLYINSVEQTRINSHQEGTLIAPPNHAFLSSLLFNEVPESVLLAGSGGGELARYLNHKKPPIHGIAVEIDPLVATLAREYFQFPQTHWNLVVDDIRSIKGGVYDLIVADIAEDKLTPDWLTDVTMIKQFKQQLSSNGVLAINLLVTNADAFSRTLQTLRAQFDKRTLCLSIPEHKNIIAFAFKEMPRYHSIDELSARLNEIKKDWKLDLSAELAQLQTDNPVGSGIF